MNEIALKYIGNGFLPGVPASDLTEEEIKEHGGEKFLISTGLYAKPDQGKPAKKEGE